MELYGLQITALLKKMDWSQKILAHHLRVTPQYINALVRNKKGLSDKKAASIAAVANLTLEEFKVLHLIVAQNQHLLDTTNPEILSNALKFMHQFLDPPDLHP
ncbi:MAG: helix-turn-helix transcriptional regulator [Saprospiraceae bacterium]|nr:helix-turn-helix transcriptional regulator [Saprospiraceae bacterium]